MVQVVVLEPDLRSYINVPETEMMMNGFTNNRFRPMAKYVISDAILTLFQIACREISNRNLTRHC
jgi:hypothetical protein